MSRTIRYAAVGAALAVTVFAAISLVSSDTAVAGKPQGGGQGSSAVLTVTPGVVPSGTVSITIVGTGFSPNADVMVGPRGVIPTWTIRTDGAGAFTLEYAPWDGGFDTPGLYYVDAKSLSRKRTLLATTTFWVQ